MKSSCFKLLFALFCAGFIAGPGAAAAQGRPDIVVIVADDLGYMDLRGYNPDSFYDTPYLDAMAAEGAMFTNAYAASPVCSPSRYALMTGRYPSRVGATNWFSGKRFGRFLPTLLHDRMDLHEVTVAELLREQGYRTAFIGKWHLGEEESYWPEHQGFDLNRGGYSNGGPRSYFSPYKNPRLADGPKGEHLPERLTQEAMDFLAAGGEQPKFVFLSYYSVHIPLQAPAHLVEKYRQRAEALEVDEFGSEQEVWPVFNWLGPRKVRIAQTHPTYAAMVESMDAQVGRLLAAIERQGRAQDTVVIFTSDNGGLSTSEGRPTANAPLRGGKGWVYEGGIREPFIVHAPGRVAASIIDEPVSGIDLLPTVLAVAGAEPPADIDGVSLLPLIGNDGAPAARALYWHYPHYSNQGGFPGGAVRRGNFKLVENYEDGSTALYDLATDIGETTDLSGQYPQQAQALRRELHAWYREVGAQFLRRAWFSPGKPWRPPAD